MTKRAISLLDTNDETISHFLETVQTSDLSRDIISLIVRSARQNEAPSKEHFNYGPYISAGLKALRRRNYKPTPSDLIHPNATWRSFAKRLGTYYQEENK